MSSDKDHQIINDLYQTGNNDEPPEFIDKIIHDHAKSPVKRNNWRPWLAAASILLTVPLFVFLSLQPALLEAPATESIITNEDSGSNESIHMTEELPSREHMSNAQELAPAPASAIAEEDSEVVVHQSTTSSLESNRNLLKEELRAQKRSLKPANLTPILALEIQQFEQFIEEGLWDQAQTLLEQMKVNYPDYSFQSLDEALAQQKPQ